MKGSQLIISKKINFVLANSADPDEMPHNGSSLFAQVHVYGFLVFKGLI